MGSNSELNGVGSLCLKWDYGDFKLNSVGSKGFTQDHDWLQSFGEDCVAFEYSNGDGSQESKEGCGTLKDFMADDSAPKRILVGINALG